MNSMGNLRRHLAAGVVGLSLAAAAQQQPTGIAPPPRVEAGPQRRKASLREALQLAAKQGPDVAAARAQAAVVGAGVQRAWTSWQPDIVATGTFDRTNATSVLPPGTFGPSQTQPITLLARDSRYATFEINQPFLTPQGLFLPGIAN